MLACLTSKKTSCEQCTKNNLLHSRKKYGDNVYCMHDKTQSATINYADNYLIAHNKLETFQTLKIN
jgi:hypothetical protein